MDVYHLIKELDSDFYTGVPDSQLAALCDYLVNEFGISGQHVIAANEGNSTALAAGYYLATGKVPVVYMQNSGIGNIVNPVVSLLNEKIYGIPCVFIIGWRGEIGGHDEPQHIFQGEISQKLLEDIGIYTFVLDKEVSAEELREKVKDMRHILEQGKSVAFLVKKNVLTYDAQNEYKNSYTMIRESVIEQIVGAAGRDIIVSTTGKASRELYEIRDRKGQGHQCDFLTVGSMGHSSSIALGIALNKPDTKIWCIDGDGAALMHMGALATIGNSHPLNMIHIMINNGAHETVGGMPTAASNVNWTRIAEGCGYPYVSCVKNYRALQKELLSVKVRNDLSFLEIQCSITSRIDLGRPATTAEDNKNKFMDYLKTLY